MNEIKSKNGGRYSVFSEGHSPESAGSMKRKTLSKAKCLKRNEEPNDPKIQDITKLIKSKNGGRYRARTCDPLNVIQMRYQLR